MGLAPYNIIRTFFTLLRWLIIIRVIISWIRPNTRDPRWRKALTFIYSVTEPILGPIRKFIPTTSSGIDFSPIVAILVLAVAESLVMSLIGTLMF